MKKVSTKKQEYKKPKKVLLLGSGALRIGQAGEFDYSGSQALKALKEEGIKSVLINPNIASIQTDEGFADKVYFLPVNTYFVEKIIQKEKIDAILLSFGGQTALNCGLELEEKGILKKYKVRVLGTPVKTIRLTEDRHLFAEALKKIGVKTAISKAVYSVSDAVEAAIKIGFPVMMRSGFSLGGKGSAIVANVKECKALAEMSFASVSQILVEECLFGWKEIEYEVVRDGNDNCITVCNMENFDPMGIHTGESIVVAPSQTLDDYEYQMLRDVAIKTIRHLGIVGECNIQYALDPKSREYRVIEVNARLSRSSALASKATGYPLAYVAAKIALGYEMAEIPNAITKVTTSFFEPALDYIVCKFPRWDLAKFDNVDQTLGTEMKSVGEVMAIGRSFAEVIQKAIRMLEIGTAGLDPEAYTFDNIEAAVKTPTPKRIFAIAKAMLDGMSVDKIHDLTKIDKFFLYEIERIVKIKKEIKTAKFTSLKAPKIREIKKAGFADRFIAKITGEAEGDIRKHRQNLGIRPHLSQIDTMAAEYPAETNFLYFTYANDKSDIVPSKNKKVIVLGSGCYRIGASVEFDWCAVSSVKAAQQLGYEVIMLNYNPETVSTDYDNCEQLVFDEIHLENVVELYEFENPEGVIVSMGGQTPNNLALKLHKEGVKIIGTSAESIDQAEDRNKFSAHLDRIKVDQPKWAEASSSEDTLEMVKRLGGFPVLVRPSYVLSGAAMRVADSPEELNVFLGNAADISPEHPVTISKFEGHSREIEFDAVAYKGEVKLFAITEHIENAGVHSGDATLVIPPQWITSEIMSKVRSIGELLAKELNITGPFNVQMLSREHNVKVIECNLRASRSFPYISKALGINFITEATTLMLSGKTTHTFDKEKVNDLKYVVVKSSQFSFSRLKGADPRLGVEMASTGEVACFGKDRSEALLASLIASGFKVPQKGAFISLEQEGDRPGFSSQASLLAMIGLKLYATPETAEVFKKLGVECRSVSISEMIKDNNPDQLIEFLKSGKIDMVISVPGPGRVYTSKEGYFLRRLAVDLEISLLTDLRLTKAAIQALSSHEEQDIAIKSWQDYHKEHVLV